MTISVDGRTYLGNNEFIGILQRECEMIWDTTPSYPLDIRFLHVLLFSHEDEGNIFS
jgi:hypothetical protein